MQTTPNFDEMRRITRPRRRAAFVGMLAVSAAPAAFAGPPFLTDEPEPTDTGHWEIYAPAFDATGRTPEFDGSDGAEFNYGISPDVQLTVGAPVGYTHASGGLTAGRADLEASVKFRIFNDEPRGLQIAVFPGITVPTATSGSSRTTTDQRADSLMKFCSSRRYSRFSSRRHSYLPRQIRNGFLDRLFQVSRSGPVVTLRCVRRLRTL